MNERLLQFIWQNKLFNFSALRTFHNEPIEITNVGFLNTYDGPDFSNARLNIDGIDWAGTVELHCKDTEWLSHGHQNDARYGSVILHVVWEVADEITVPEGVPCLVLKTYVSEELLERYTALMDSRDEIACLSQLPQINSLYRLGAVEDALYHRIKRKSSLLKSKLLELENDWQQMFFYLLATCLGKKANKEVMSDLGERLPVKYLFKNIENPLAVEALVFGVAGFLEEPEDEYAVQLAKEFSFLKHKYNLSSMSKLRWNHSKVRGLSRPCLSLAMLCASLNVIRNIQDVNTGLEGLEQIKLNEYWKEHYIFGKKSKTKNSITVELLNHVKINVIVPYLGLLSDYYDESKYLEQANELLNSVKKEKNSIVSKMSVSGFEVLDAASSQGVIELHNEYCLRKKCLDCKVGTHILRRS